MIAKRSLQRIIGALTLTLALAYTGTAFAVDGWLNWRGPSQVGISLEKGLPSVWKPDGENHLWTMNLGGGGTPIIADGRVYAFGYEGQGAELQEVLVCADAETGKKLWERRFNDFISDIVYDRYTIGSPCVDAETGNVYVLTSAGLFTAFTRDGKELWQHSMMDEYGRLTFTNGRTGGPIIEQDLVIVRGITSNWGGEGAARDRLYAFDKKSGQLVWSCTPSGAPKDNSFAMPVFGWRKGQRVFYTGAGDGSIICANARTGKPLWRYPVSAGGMNASVIPYKDTIIGIHADENLDSSTAGRMVAIKFDSEGKPDAEGLANLDKSAEAWRIGIGTVSSSPVIVGNRIYQVLKTGQLVCVDADTGKILWEYKLGPDQLHASPLYADGKLYVPLQNGLFFILQPSDSGVKELTKVQLPGRCIGAPSVWNGKVYVFSTEKLFCFGKKGKNPAPAKVKGTEYPKPGPTVALQIVPAEVMLRPGEKAKFTVRGIDANGFVTQTFDNSKVTWEKFIPPTARVRSEMDANFQNGELVAAPNAKPSAGAYQATVGDFKGTFRGRVVPRLPITEDFESFTPTEPAVDKPDEKFAYPPLSWIGIRFKFDVRELEGNKVLAKTLDNIFFQRATGFIGHPDETNYTMEADVMTDGNRRTLGIIGIINQRYLITLVGNSQELEISSNVERIKVGVPFEIKPKVWYHLKTRVDVAQDGSGVVRAKAWKKGDPEPEKWTLEVPHKVAHRKGAPGLFGFSPQSLFRVYIDNVKVTPNQ